ncbi:hypothetical protein D3C85_1945490 [compost metagenome]
MLQDAAGLEVLHLVLRVDAAQHLDFLMAAIGAQDVQGQAHVRAQADAIQAADANLFLAV